MHGISGRLFRLIDLLQGGERHTVDDLAERLAVSERTVRRDLARLHDLEIAVTVTPGRGGGVRLEPGALLPALRFTDDEALALGFGLRLVGRLGAAGLVRAAESASRRLGAVLGASTRRRIDALASTRVAPADRDTGGVPAVEGALVLDLAEAARDRRRLELGYRSGRGEITRRRVDPYGLVHLDGRWYLAGWCHLRAGVRVFRLDRVRRAHTLDERFEAPNDVDAYRIVADALAAMPVAGGVRCRVRLACSPVEARRFVPPQVALLEPDEAGVILTFTSAPERLEAAALHLLMAPWPLEIEGPDALRRAFRSVAERARSVAGTPPPPPP